jgi:Na+/H+ antiporter NhaD/arsenite permease-like protein
MGGRLVTVWRSRQVKRAVLIGGLLGALLITLLTSSGAPAPVLAQDEGVSLSGTILDAQGQPVCDAEVLLFAGEAVEPLASAATHCEDGTFLLVFEPDRMFESLYLAVEHPHFAAYEQDVDPGIVAQVNARRSVLLPGLTLERRITAGFWIATITFVAVLALIALERLHNALAALLGMGLVLACSAFGTSIPGLFIFDFERALNYVNFEVIFLVMGMMIVIAAIEETGIFQWMTYQAYRLSGGRIWLLVVILMFITAIASALLDNVTTMLLMTPLSIQIALALGLSPFSILIPEVLASNVGGISTLIGTPTNILIGTYAGLSFNNFLANLTPGVLLAQLALIGYVILRFRKSWSAAGDEVSETLMERLAEAGQITEPIKLRKAGIVFAVMLTGFVLGERVHLTPAVTAMVGAVVILLWVAPDIETMMQSVDWTTLMFFIALFILVGALQEVGLLSIIAGVISRVVGENLVVTMLVLIWSSALLSGVIANIPFTAAMLPVVQFLSRTVPGATSNVLFYCLSVGSAMGGNSTLIGASANMVTTGIAERAGFRITYVDFLKVGMPATALTVAVGSLWLLIRFVLGGG